MVSRDISALSEWGRVGVEAEGVADLTPRQTQLLQQIDIGSDPDDNAGNGHRFLPQIKLPYRDGSGHSASAGAAAAMAGTASNVSTRSGGSLRQGKKAGSSSSAAAATALSEDPNNGGSQRSIATSRQFVEWFYTVEDQIQRDADRDSRTYLSNLNQKVEEIRNLQSKVDEAISLLEKLKDQHDFASDKSNRLHRACQHLMEEQNQLATLNQAAKERLAFFNEADGVIQKLGLPSFSLHTDAFSTSLDKIDACLHFLSTKPKYKDVDGHTVRYKAALSKTLGVAKDYVRLAFLSAASSASAAASPGYHPPSSSTSDQAAEEAFNQIYSKYRAQVPKVEGILRQLEQRSRPRLIGDGESDTDESPYFLADPTVEEYRTALQECQAMFFDSRSRLLLPSVRSTVMKVCSGGGGSSDGSGRSNFCSTVRSCCAIFLHVSEDEYRLYRQFFSLDCEAYKIYTDSLCILLYDALRPIIVGLHHLETLSELTTILRGEMLDYHCAESPFHLRSFEDTVNLLMQDVQERLIFRTHIYIKSDILDYVPHPGDLLYPEKLQMMESIQDSILMQQEDEELEARIRNQSVSSSVSVSSLEVANYNRGGGGVVVSGSSPVDMHGMWYPTVRRALVCLSRLYRSVDTETFQGLSQEVLDACTESLERASQGIASRSGELNGLLFLVKHLLIVREQITPFQVQLAVLETSLDFTKLKTAALSLLQRGQGAASASPAAASTFGSSPTFADNRGSSSSNNLIRSILDGATPDVREHCRDSRREVDRKLKLACEGFIAAAVRLMVDPMRRFLQTVKESKAGGGNQGQKVSEQDWGQSQAVREIVASCTKRIKHEFPNVQKLLHLYLCNKETEFILFRPVRNEVLSTFMVLRALVTAEYSPDECLIIGCPSQEQVAMLLASLQIQQATAKPPQPVEPAAVLNGEPPAAPQVAPAVAVEPEDVVPPVGS